MNSSAKVTVVTLLAAGALGVALVSACTVTSGTNSDTDGGLRSSSGTSGSGTSGGTSSGGTSSGGTSSGGATCASNQDAGAPIRSAACQTCLNAKCCSQLQKCFAIPATSTSVDCNTYHECIEKAANQSDEDLCDTAAGNSGVVEAYQAIADCEHGGADAGPGADNCQHECENR